MEFLDSSTCFVNIKLRKFVLYFLDVICKEQPKYLLSCQSKLLKQISSTNVDEQVANYTLKILSTLNVNQDKEAFRPHQGVLLNYVLKGTEVQSKHALKILYAVTASKNIMVSELVQTLFDGLNFNNPNLHV